jgi:hypothetical protein
MVRRSSHVKQEDRGAVSKVCEISMALFTHGTQALFVWLKSHG